ncbi:MAG: TIGR02206 family membrane protein [Balneola sp.]
MNSFFDTTHTFIPYSAEHLSLLFGFLAFMIWFIRFMGTSSAESQRKTLLGISIALSIAQLAKIPLNSYTGTFDVTKDIPLHMCNFLPFIMVAVYYTKNRVLWATVFFWIILGVSQANFTPSVEYSLFHYDAIRYWMVHMGLVLLALYPAITWKWELELKDVARTIIWLNVAAVFIYGMNLLLGSNYLYVMGKPPGTTFFSILPPWPTYILVLEVILVIWSLMVLGIFKLIKSRRTSTDMVMERSEIS